MFDFCFTFPYAAFLAVGGLLGFVAKASVPSLAGGLGSGIMLSAFAYVSLQEYHKGRLCKPATFGSLVVAAALAYIMYQRYLVTHKLFPAGITAGISGAMCAFYLWNLAAGPVPKVHKAA